MISGNNRLFAANCGDHPKSRSRLGLMFERVCVCRRLIEITSTPSWSGIGQVARLADQDARSCARFGPLTEGSGPTSNLGSLLAPRVVCRCSPVGFDRQQDVADKNSAQTEETLVRPNTSGSAEPKLGPNQSNFAHMQGNTKRTHHRHWFYDNLIWGMQGSTHGSMGPQKQRK
jgi:hypothetical protein